MPSCHQKPSHGEETGGTSRASPAPDPPTLLPEEQRATGSRVTGGHSPPRCLPLHVSPDWVQRGHGPSTGPLQPQPRPHDAGLEQTQRARFPRCPAAHSPGPAARTRWRLPAQHPVPPRSGHHSNTQNLPRVRRDPGAQGQRSDGEEIPNQKSRRQQHCLQVQGPPPLPRAPLRSSAGAQDSWPSWGEVAACLGTQGSYTGRTHSSQDPAFNRDWQKPVRRVDLSSAHCRNQPSEPARPGSSTAAASISSPQLGLAPAGFPHAPSPPGSNQPCIQREDD